MADQAQHPRILTSTPWQGRDALDLVHALNHRVVNLLAKLAYRKKQSTGDFVTSYRELWCALDPMMRTRAADLPVLLLDMNFQRCEWWQWAIASTRSEWKGTNALPPFLSPRDCIALTRETLMLAWHVARIDRDVACALLGMSHAVSMIVENFQPRDIDRISTRHARFLRPRWEDMRWFWGNLLSAAKGSDDRALHEIRLHAVRLLGSELMSCSSYLTKAPGKK